MFLTYPANHHSNTDHRDRLLMHFDGSNGGTTFIDSSIYGRTVTVVGNSNTSTAQSKFGGSSAYFDGVGDYLTVPDSSTLELGSSDFTIDLWVRSDTTTGVAGIVSKSKTSATGPFIIYRSLGNFLFYGSSNDSSYDIASALSLGTCTANTWTHLAVTRSGSTIRTFQDGTFVTSTTSSASFVDNSQSVVVGSWSTASNDFKGYIDELRISIGVARWTSSFTAPTAPYYS